MTDNNKLQLNLKGITVDFEPAQINVLLSGLRLTAFLFHLKQALWRWCRSHRLTLKNNINESREIIDQLSRLCWNPSQKSEVLCKMKAKYLDTEFAKLIKYFEDYYSEFFDQKILDYSDILHFIRIRKKNLKMS